MRACCLAACPLLAALLTQAPRARSYEKFYETKSGDTAISQHLVMEARRVQQPAHALLTRSRQLLTRTPPAVSVPRVQLMSGGDLMVDVLLKRRTLRGLAGEWMSAAEVRVATWRILKGLEFMHAKKCLHRDLKPENCLLKQRLPDGCGDAATLKLADFGHSKLVPPDVSRAYTNNKGTAAYAAPEMAAQMILGSTVRRAACRVGACTHPCLCASHEADWQLRHAARGRTAGTPPRRTCGRWASSSTLWSCSRFRACPPHAHCCALRPTARAGCAPAYRR